MKFTVIGFHGDNHQPWMAQVDDATDQRDAALQGIQKIFEASEASVEIEDLFVVEVIKGHHKGGLGNEACLTRSDLEAGDIYHVER
jgi:hypothetical protein